MAVARERSEWKRMDALMRIVAAGMRVRLAPPQDERRPSASVAEIGDMLAQVAQERGR